MPAFFLVRHGAHDLAGDVLVGRTIEIGLNPVGHAQAAALAQGFRETVIARVLSSPRRRARETAQPIADAVGLPLEIAAALDEHHAGDWSGQRFDTLAKDPAWHAWNIHRATACCPGGENMADLQERVLAFLIKLSAHHRGENLVLVSHAEPIRAALLAARGLPPDKFAQVDVPLASVHPHHIESQSKRSSLAGVA